MNSNSCDLVSGGEIWGITKTLPAAGLSCPTVKVEPATAAMATGVLGQTREAAGGGGCWWSQVLSPLKASQPLFFQEQEQSAVNSSSKIKPGLCLGRTVRTLGS